MSDKPRHQPASARSKQSEHQLKRLLETALREELATDVSGGWVVVRELKATGQPISRIEAWVGLYMPAPASGMQAVKPAHFTGERLARLEQAMASHLHLRQEVKLVLHEGG